MSDDQYDELMNRRRWTRAEQENEEQRQRAAQQRIEQVFFYRRNALYTAVAKRAEELEKRYPDLGQLFVRPFGDRLDLIKSKHPSGSFTMNFDPFQRTVSGSFRNSGESFEYEMQPVVDQDTIELWSGGRPRSDEEIVRQIFDQFMEEIS